MRLNKVLKLMAIILILELIVVGLFGKLINEIGTTNIMMFVIGSLVSTFGFIIGSRFFHCCVKKEFGGLQPNEIAMLYSENKSIIEQLTEGIISTDKDYNITTINKQSKTMFGLTDEDVSKKVYDVFPHVDFEAVLVHEKQRYNRLIEVNNVTMLVSYFPLYANDNVIGATAIFRSRLEVDMLLDQISGYQKISKALREQKHEFQNKLHVILGLIRLKDYEMAQDYISQSVYTTNLTSDYYSSRIFDDKISALFVGKEIQSKEYGVTITLSSNSNLTKKHHPVNSDDLIVVIGNLIDNSLEAYGNKDIDKKVIKVSIMETESDIIITVTDNAGGVAHEVLESMFRRGVSTKSGENRGTGLSLVRQIVKIYNGTRKVDTDNKNTKIEIRLSKEKI